MAKSYEGGCLCGHIRFIAHGSPNKPHTCSCKICQRHSGALTQAWVEFHSENVEWTGPDREVNRKLGVLLNIRPEAFVIYVAVPWVLSMMNPL